jgi:hypothetical protein
MVEGRGSVTSLSVAIGPALTRTGFLDVIPWYIYKYTYEYAAAFLMLAPCMSQVMR